MPDPASPPPDWPGYWNERYQREPSRYGDEPNQFVAALMAGMSARRVLDAGCGQGRNAVWLALEGHDVTAVDLSDVAIAQARRLAQEAGVVVEFHVADVTEWKRPAGGFDAVLLSYVQLPPEDRRRLHAKVRDLLAPEGMVFVVAHHADNLSAGVGGPQYPEVLYRESDLASDFADFGIERNERVVRRVEREDLEGDALDLVFVARAGSGSDPAD